MKWIFTAAACLWATSSVHGLVEPALPAWDPDVRKELVEPGWLAGASLLTEQAIPDEPVAEDTLSLEPPNPEEISSDDEPVPQVAEDYIEAYFAARPETFLVDPQGLLSEPVFRDRLAFLNYHASDSTIDLFVYLIRGDEEIPSEVRKDEMIERFFKVFHKLICF